MATPDNHHEESISPSGPLLIFVLGAPCSGKSTLCTTLSHQFSLDHFSLGGDLRSLLSDNPTGHAARIKSKLTASEIAIFDANVRAGTLGPANQTLKYVKERIFPDGVDKGGVRILIDGFPRSLDRWLMFKESVEGLWKPDSRTLLLVLKIGADLGYQRFIGRDRPGDIFENRYQDHENNIVSIVEAMKEDGVGVLEVAVKEGRTIEEMVDALKSSEAWKKAFN